MRQAMQMIVNHQLPTISRNDLLSLVKTKGIGNFSPTFHHQELYPPHQRAINLNPAVHSPPRTPGTQRKAIGMSDRNHPKG
jgi:hypothetical protein